MAKKTKKKGKKWGRRRKGDQFVCSSGYVLGARSPKTGKKFKAPTCVATAPGSFRTRRPRTIRERKPTKRGLGPQGRMPIIPQRAISVRGLKGGTCGCT